MNEQSTPLTERLRSRAWEHRQHRKYREEAAAEIERLTAALSSSEAARERAEIELREEAEYNGPYIHMLERENKRLQEREAYFAKLLGVADGGRYRADWDSRIAALLSERQRVEQDAARYRWLRRDPSMLLHLKSSEFDAAIDAAIQETPK